jgi:hypothetical protein
VKLRQAFEGLDFLRAIDGYGIPSLPPWSGSDAKPVRRDTWRLYRRILKPTFDAEPAEIYLAAVVAGCNDARILPTN